MQVLVLRNQPLKEIPEEIQIVPMGRFVDGYGQKFRFLTADLLRIMANAREKVNDLVIDYEHQTLSGGQAPAAGWITELVNKDEDGLWAKVEWTSNARQRLEDREYRYLSPVLLGSEIDREGCLIPEHLHSAALTNTPQIDGMVPIINTKSLESFTQTIEERVMTELLKELGLPETATEDQAREAIIVLKKQAGTPRETEVIPGEIMEALGLKSDAGFSEVKATVLALKQSDSVVEEVRLLQKTLAGKEAGEQVSLALKSGKISASQQEWAREYALKDPAGFKVFVAKAPVTVPMGGSFAGGEPPTTTDSIKSADEVAAAVNKGGF